MIATTTPTNPWQPESLLADYFAKVYARLKLVGKSASTKRLYAVTIKNFGVHLERPATLGDFTDDTVTALLAWGMETRNWSPRTANKHRDQLLAIWRFACRKRHIEIWPDVEPVSEYKRIPQAWSTEELQRILQSCKETRGLVCGIPAGAYWFALVLTLYDTGLRASAMFSAQWQHFNPAEKSLFIAAERQKHRSDQCLMLSNQTIAALDRIRSPERELLFPWDMAETYRWNRYSRILKRAGLPHGRFDKFHRIRKTTATMVAISAGAAAATDILGHSSGEMTKRYIDPTKTRTANIVDSIPRPDMTDVPNRDDAAAAITLTAAVDGYLAMLKPLGIDGNCKPVNGVRRFLEHAKIERVGELTPAVVRTYLGAAAAMFSIHTVQDYREALAWFLWWLVDAHQSAGAAACIEAFQFRSRSMPWRGKAGDA